MEKKRSGKLETPYTLLRAAYGFRRHPLVKVSRRSALWQQAVESCRTVVQHMTSTKSARTFRSLRADAVSYYEQENEPIPPVGDMAYDLIKLIEVGLVIIEPVPSAQLDDRLFYAGTACRLAYAGTACPVCGEKQFTTPSGLVCRNGHGF